jgi:5-methylcytosine-specific restriction endonuclease McrA
MPKKSYSELLRDPRWQKKRLEVLNAANFKCEDCGCADKELQVHHCHYQKGKQPWEHDKDFLMCLCSSCHEVRQIYEDGIRSSVGRLNRFSTSAEVRERMWDSVKQGSEKFYAWSIEHENSNHKA